MRGLSDEKIYNKNNIHGLKLLRRRGKIGPFHCRVQGRKFDQGRVHPSPFDNLLAVSVIGESDGWIRGGLLREFPGSKRAYTLKYHTDGRVQRILYSLQIVFSSNDQAPRPTRYCRAKWCPEPRRQNQEKIPRETPPITTTIPTVPEQSARLHIKMTPCTGVIRNGRPGGRAASIYTRHSFEM